jgi:hypothetical protein
MRSLRTARVILGNPDPNRQKVDLGLHLSSTTISIYTIFNAPSITQALGLD